MTKNILFSFLFACSFLPSNFIFAQTIDQCGIDNNPKLTEIEAEFLNNYFKGNSPSFDFQSKKILFIKSPGGSSFMDKKEYFENIKSYQNQDRRIATTLIILSEKEKIKSGGYDAIVTCWVKVFSKWRKKRMIKKAGKTKITP